MDRASGPAGRTGRRVAGRRQPARSALGVPRGVRGLRPRPQRRRRSAARPGRRRAAADLPPWPRVLGRHGRRLGRPVRPRRRAVRGQHAARLPAASGRVRRRAADAGDDQRQRRLAPALVAAGRADAHGPRLERLRLRRAGPAVDAVRARGAVPARLGGRADPGRRRAGRPARRRCERAHRLRHQPGRLLASTGLGLRAPVRRRGGRPGGRGCVHVLDGLPSAGDGAAARLRAEGPVQRYMQQVRPTRHVERTFAFRARPYGVDDPFELFTEVGSTSCATSSGTSAPPC